MKLGNSILGAIAALLVILFAVSNRAPVSISIWPFPFEITLGLYAVILFAVLIGFVAGAIGAWLMGSQRRRQIREARRQIRDLELSLARHRVTPKADGL